MNPIFPIVLYSQGSSASIPSQRRMHGCVVLASSAASLPCKRAGRRASSGISFCNAVQQAQLSYPKRCATLPPSGSIRGIRLQILSPATTLLDGQHLEDVDSLIHHEVLCDTTVTILHPLDQPTRSRQDPIFPTATSPRCTSHAICTSHTTAAKRLRTTAFWASPVLGTWAMAKDRSNGLLA